MRKIRSRILFIFLALTMLGTIAYHYVNAIFIPGKFKDYVINKAETALSRKVSIENIRFEFIKGFTLEDIKIFEKDNHKKPLLTAHEITFNILLFDLIKSRSAIIPTLTLNTPSIYLSENQNQTWNISDLFPENIESSATKPSNLIIRKVSLSKGSLHLTRLFNGKPDTLQLNNLNGEAKISLTTSIDYLLSAELPTDENILKLNGSFNLINRQFDTDFKTTKIDVKRHLPFITQNLPLVLNHAKLTNSSGKVILNKNEKKVIIDFGFNSLDAAFDDFTFDGDVQATDFIFNTTKDGIQLSSLIKSPNGRLKRQGQTLLKGNISTELKKVTLSQKQWDVLGNLDIHKAELNVNNQNTLKGHITGSNVSIKKAGETLSIAGDYKVNHALIKAQGIQYLQGQLSFPNLNLSSKENFWVISSQIETLNTELKIDANKSVSGDVHVKHSDLKISPTTIELSLPLTITNSQINYYQLFRGTADIASDNITISVKDNIATLKTLLKAKDTKLAINQKSHFKGSPEINLNLTKNLSEKSLNYNGSATLTNASLSTPHTEHDIEKISGTVAFDPKTYTTTGLSVLYDDSTFSLSGKLTDPKKPHFKGDIKSNKLNIKHIKPYIEKNLADLEADIDGQTVLRLTYDGLVNKPKESIVKVTSIFKDAKIQSKKLPSDIELINGQLEYSDNLIEWRNLNGKFNNQIYTITGNITNFSRPVVWTTLETEDLKLKTKLKILRKYFEIETLTGSFGSSVFDLTGDVQLKEKPTPYYSLDGTVKLDLGDLNKLPENIRSKISPLDPSGEVYVQGLFRGEKDDWRNWQLTFKATSNEIKIKNHPIKNFLLDYAQRDNYISQFSLLAYLYNGELKLDSTANLLGTTIPIDLSMKLSELDLANYRKNNKVKNRHLSGKFSLVGNVSGPILEKNQLTGSGQFAIKDGYLGQLMKEFKQAEFTEAAGDFNIRQGKILTDNTKIYSQAIGLRVKGWVDFDQNINFDIVPDFGEAGILKTDNISIDATPFISNAVSMTITGSLKHPIKKVNKSPGKIIGNTTEIITDTIGTIFRGIIQ